MESQNSRRSKSFGFSRMGGQFLLGDYSIRQWFDEQARHLSQRQSPFFTVNHLDEIGVLVGSASEAVTNGITLLRQTGQLINATGIDIYPRLAIPFGLTEALEVALPDLRAAPALALSEPPSLYLFGIDYMNVPPDREEYRCAYETNPWGDDLVAEYACGRSLYERHRGWEFTQTVWVSSTTR